MTRDDRQEHWESVYESKASTEVSWYQPTPTKSLELIRQTGIRHEAAIIDIGGGASTLVDHLLDEGYTDITVLDVAGGAFAHTRDRLGQRAADVNFVVADVTTFAPSHSYQLWHDRAVLHFLTDADDRARYVQTLERALAPGSHLVLSSFGPDGPDKCSGLEIRRYNIDDVAELVGGSFELQHWELENHKTPWDAEQQFLYSRWTRRE
jgi:SAM-dependent methyltransferase